MKIIDNLLEYEQVESIEKELISDTFPWFYQETVADKKDIEHFYFTHLFYDHGSQSNYFNLIIPILKKIKYKKLIRVKGNLYPRTNKNLEHGKHVDYDFITKGALYYLNTNNGPTCVENKKIESIKNRLLLFDASKKHNSVTCTDKKIRLNININYL